MNTKSENQFVIGLISGVVLALAIGIVVLKSSSSSTSNNKSRTVLAELDGASLTREELPNNLKALLIPSENDEYQVLSTGVRDWLENELIQREAQSKKVSAQELYAKEIWSQVRVSPDEAAKDYQKNKILYGNQPYEKVAALITENLRTNKFESAKQLYLDKLIQKFHAKVYLRKPLVFAPGLGIANPSTNPAGQNAGQKNLPSGQQSPQPAAPVVTFNDLADKPSMGPNNAPVTLVEFSDFMCPFCKKVTPTVDELMKKFPGKIRRVWRHYPLPFHQGSDRIHMAAACANEQGKFWEFHDKAFAAQGGAHDDAALNQMAEQISGLDKKKFQACLSSEKYKALMQQEIQKGNSVGVNGTPAFFINGRLLVGAQPLENFVNEVEAALDPKKAAALAAKQAQAQAQQAPRPVAPPTNVQFTDLAGRPAMGPENAPITLVIFSDFHCPFCKRVEPTIDQLMKNYSGKIRKIWRQYPLPFHQGADHTAEASECAHEQGKFWPYHGKLMETQGGSRDDAALNQIADQLKLNTKKFQECLTSGKYKELIKKEIAKGSEVGVSGTPAVFVNGQLVSGAQPYEAFDAVVKSKLEKK